MVNVFALDVFALNVQCIAVRRVPSIERHGVWTGQNLRQILVQTEVKFITDLCSM